MKLVHFSKSSDFQLKAKESVPGFGKGVFFYNLEEWDAVKNGWSDRTPHYFEAPDEVVEIVQTFDDGEIRGQNDEPLPGFSEYFVRAKNLKHVKEL